MWPLRRFSIALFQKHTHKHTHMHATYTQHTHKFRLNLRKNTELQFLFVYWMVNAYIISNIHTIKHVEGTFSQTLVSSDIY